MNKESAAASAGLLNPAVRAQIRSLAERDGVPSEQIASMLGIPLLIVQEVMQSAGAKVDAKQVPADGVEAQLSERAAQIEDRLADAEQTALAVLEDVCANAQSDMVRAVVAEKILKIRTGGLRPPKQSGVQIGITIETMNTLIQQAVGAYQNQLKPPEQVSTPPTVPQNVIVHERN
jgi:hypothetical protein